MIVRYMLLAESVVQDIQTSWVSIFNVMDAIRPQGFPVLIQKCSVLVALTKEAHDPVRVDCAVSLTMGGNELARLPVTVDFQDKLKNNTIMQLLGLVIPGPGELVATFYQNDVPLESTVFLVEAAAPLAGVQVVQTQR